MTFEEKQALISQALQQERRISYLALQCRFSLDDKTLAAIKEELIQAKRLALDEQGQVLVWRDQPLACPPPPSAAELRLHATLPVIVPLLAREGRLSYRTLSMQFGLQSEHLEALREELLFKRLAIEEDGKGLVWTGPAPDKTHSIAPTPFTDFTYLAPSDQTYAANPLPVLPNEKPSPPQSHKENPTPARAEAERRQLTVMFCDVVGSTTLSGQLDPEDLREVIRAYQQTAAQVIDVFDGHIAQYLGDGLLVYFGFPQAHEDDGRRAVHAGLGIITALVTLNIRLAVEYGIQLAVRLGIHTGPVVVGEMGGGGRHEQLALGETPNIAARLQDCAEPNTVVISENTARLVRNAFALAKLPPQKLKGISETITLSRVLGPLANENDHEITVQDNLPLGREEEISLLRRCWARSKEGLGQVVLISGEAGIGKSVLVDVVRQQVCHEQTNCITYRCSPYHSTSPLYPIIAYFSRLLDLQPNDTPANQLDKLERGLQTLRTLPTCTVPLMAKLLGIPLPAERYENPTLSPLQQRQETLDTLLAWLVEAAERQPMLVIWEDLQLADPSTLELLGLVIDSVATIPLLLVLTFRHDFLPPWPLHSHLTPIILRRLERPQVEGIIRWLANDKPLPPEVIEHIVNKTDGIPLFVEELTKMLLDSVLLCQEDGYVLTSPLSTLTIPDTLQDSLMARLDQLNAAKDVVQMGAVLGREFTYGLLRALSEIEDATLEAGLIQLVEAELFSQRGHPPQATYTFKHALIQDTAYEALLRSTRQQYHAQVVQLLQTQFTAMAQSNPELLAHHAFCGKLWEQAYRAFHQVGMRAMERSAYQEAVAGFEQAHAALSRLPTNKTTDTQTIDLHCELRQALMPLGEFNKVLDTLHDAEQLATHIDDPERLGRVISYQANLLWEMGKQSQAITSCHRALDIALTIKDSILESTAQRYLGRSSHAVGDYRQAIALLTPYVASPHEPMVSTPFTSESSRVFLVLSLAEVGDFAEGILYGKAGLARATARHHDFDLSAGCAALGRLYLYQGLLAEAVQVLQQGLAVCQQAQLPLIFPMIAAPLGMTYALLGQTARALPLLEQAVTQATTMQRMVEHARWVSWLGTTSLLAGQLEASHDLASRALASARDHQEHGHEAWSLYLLGAIHTQSLNPEDDPTQASNSYQQALALAKARHMLPLQAHCYSGLSALYHQLENHHEAQQALAQANELYETLGMDFWRQKAKATLVQKAGIHILKSA